MASHLPPPLKVGGGASATARTTAIIVALTLMGLVSRKALAGTAWAGSSAGCRRKKWTRHGCLGSAPPGRVWIVFRSWRGRLCSMTGRKPRLQVAALDLYRSLELHVLKISAVAGGVDGGLRGLQEGGHLGDGK